MHFIDTNIFIRHFTNDNEKKAEACFLLFKNAKENKLELTTTESIIAEVVYVLSSKKLYNVPRKQIFNLLTTILSIKNFKVKDKTIYLKALELYSSHTIDFEDALLASRMLIEETYELYSYDEGFDTIPGVKRTLP